MNFKDEPAIRMIEYLKSQISVKEKEIDTLGGELSTLRSNLATLQQFEKQAKEGR